MSGVNAIWLIASEPIRIFIIIIIIGIDINRHVMIFVSFTSWLVGEISRENNLTRK